MHIFNYEFLRDMYLPSQVVAPASNISMILILAAVRRHDNMAAFRSLEKIATMESVKSSHAIEGVVTTDERIHETGNGSSALYTLENSK